jgi:hypothetical protein
VERTRVRIPRAAQARAVEAATEVFPTPPFPVYRIVRGPMSGESLGATLKRDRISVTSI